MSNEATETEQHELVWRLRLRLYGINRLDTYETFVLALHDFLCCLNFEFADESFR
jgi:hypothetical protein